MQHYNHEEYVSTIESIFSDLSIGELSIEAKSNQLRRYTEIVCRRLLDISNKKPLILSIAKKDLQDRGYNEEFFQNALSVITKDQKQYAHTQKPMLLTNDLLEEKIDALFTIYGYLFYRFFLKHEFGKNPDILTAFSILPPIIRYKTLSRLFEFTPNNTMVIDKLVLAILKAFDAEYALEWIEKNKELLMMLVIIQELPMGLPALQNNMYNICMEKAYQMKRNYKHPYTTFQEAKRYYNEHGIVQGESEEVIEFNSLMEFVYTGH